MRRNLSIGRQSSTEERGVNVQWQNFVGGGASTVLLLLTEKKLPLSSSFFSSSFCTSLGSV